MRRGLFIGTLSLLDCWNHLSSASSMSLCSGFQNHFILNLFHSKALTILVQFLPVVWIVEFMSPNSWHVTFLFSIFCLSYHFTVSSSAQNLPLIHGHSHVITLSASPFNYRSRNIEDNFTHRMNCELLLSFSRPGIYISIWKRRGFVFSRTMRWLNSQNNPLLGKLCWNIWLALSIYPR